MSAITRAVEARERLEAAQREMGEAAAARDAAVLELLGSGLTPGDVAQLLGISRPMVTRLRDRGRLAAWGPVAVLEDAPRPRRDLADDWPAVQHAHFLRCEAATRGAMLNRDGLARVVNPEWMLASTRATLRYASDELLEYLQTDPAPRKVAAQARAARRAVSRAW